MVEKINNELPIFSKHHELAGAQRRIDASEKTARENRVASSVEAMPTLLKERELSLLQRRLVALGTVAVAAGFSYVALQPETAPYINEKLHEFGQTFNGMPKPSPEQASTVKVGDVIRYKTNDGQIKERRVTFLSDITVAAREVDPAISYNDFDNMLIQQNKNSNIVRSGETSVEIDKNLGITDIGPSGEPSG